MDNFRKSTIREMLTLEWSDNNMSWSAKRIPWLSRYLRPCLASSIDSSDTAPGRSLAVGIDTEREVVWARPLDTGLEVRTPPLVTAFEVHTPPLATGTAVGTAPVEADTPLPVLRTALDHVGAGFAASGIVVAGRLVSVADNIALVAGNIVFVVDTAASFVAGTAHSFVVDNAAWFADDTSSGVDIRILASKVGVGCISALLPLLGVGKPWSLWCIEDLHLVTVQGAHPSRWGRSCPRAT